MHRTFKMTLFVIMTFFAAAPMFAQDAGVKPSPELIAKGKALFESKTALGGKFACVLCHKGPKVIKASEVKKAGNKLPEVINKYITKKSKGKALAADSEEMKALVAYISTEGSK